MATLEDAPERRGRPDRNDRWDGWSHAQRLAWSSFENAKKDARAEVKAEQPMSHSKKATMRNAVVSFHAGSMSLIHPSALSMLKRDWKEKSDLVFVLEGRSVRAEERVARAEKSNVLLLVMCAVAFSVLVVFLALSEAT